MQELNLPPYDYNLKTIEGKTCIFDIIRKKYLVLTPEEWVRQHFVNLLIEHLNYPKGRVSVEKGATYQRNVQKRTDVMVYDENGQVEVLIELKAPKVKLDESVFLQLAAYNKVYQANTLIISNGLETYCFQVNSENKIIFLDNIPSYKK